MSNEEAPKYDLSGVVTLKLYRKNEPNGKDENIGSSTVLLCKIVFPNLELSLESFKVPTNGARYTIRFKSFTINKNFINQKRGKS